MIGKGHAYRDEHGDGPNRVPKIPPPPIHIWLILLRQALAFWKRVSVVVAPDAHGITVMIAENVRGHVIMVTVLVVSVTFAMALRQSNGTHQR